MQRRPEPELMDDPEQALAYATSDFADVNQGFVDRFVATFPQLTAGRVIDLGCGPADIPLRLCRALPELEVLAVDGSPAMLELAKKAVNEEGLAERVELCEARLPDPALASKAWDAVVSNSLLHHLPDPAVLWSETKRLGKPGAPVLVIDLFRPESEAAAQKIVDDADCSDHPLLVRDFYNSLLAAFTVDEVRAQLDAAGLSQLSVEQISERHLLVSGRL